MGYRKKLTPPQEYFHFSKPEHAGQEKLVAPHGHFHFSKPRYRQEKLVAIQKDRHGHVEKL